MDLQTLFHAIYVGLMAVGVIYFISLSRNPRGVPQYEYVVAAFIPLWSGLAYLSMMLPQDTLEQGKLELAGRIVHFARYIDWMVTTPLLLLSLSWTVMFRMKKDWTLILSLMASQVVVIVSGLVADLSAIDWVRYLWYINGVVAFLVVLGLVWGPLRSKAREQRRDVFELSDRLMIYLTFFWIGYPIAWIIGPSGFGWVNQTIDTLLFTVLPFFSKVGFSFLDLNGLRNISDSRQRTSTDSVESTALRILQSVPTLGRLF